MTMTKEQKAARAAERKLHRMQRGVKEGDIVLLDMNGVYALSSMTPPFQARVLSLNGDKPTAGNVVITYERLDGQSIDFPNCDISYVAAIVKAAPYKVQPRRRVNVFANYNAKFATTKVGGLVLGSLDSLVRRALKQVAHVDLPRGINEDRVHELYRKDRFPGKSSSTHMIEWWHGQHVFVVNWKIFRKWVERNASRLVYTKADDAALVREHREEMSRDLWDAIETDMDCVDEQYDDSQLQSDVERELARPSAGELAPHDIEIRV